MTAGFVSAGFLIAAPVAMAGASTSGGTLFVKTTGTDTGTCRISAHPCATLDYALSVATQNSVISVGAGTFTQQLVVTKSVTIDGTAGKTFIEPSSLAVSETDPDRGGPLFAIIDVQPGNAVSLHNIIVNGSMAENQFTGCGQDYVGIFYRDATGSLTTVGVNNIELPTALQGCQDGLAVYVISDAGQKSDVGMSGLTVSSYDKNGITCHDAGTTCSIVHSTVTGAGPNPAIAQNGIEVLSTASTTISTDVVTGNSYTGGGNGNQASGLLLFDPGALGVQSNTISDNDVNVYLGSDGNNPLVGPEGTWVLHGNKVLGATDNVPGGSAFYGDGIEIDSSSNPSLTVSDNTVTGSAADGIDLLGASHVVVNGNQVNSSALNGIELNANGSYTEAGASSNLVEHNTVRASGSDGIVGDASSSQNTIHANTTSNNLRFDLEDLGTGNVWTSDGCTPPNDSSPAGLCD
jgi:parallel beta-helix repeat protein